MAPKTLDGSAFSFTTTRGHTTHISILWVFVLFTFLTVAVVLLGGYQEGLVERRLADTKVSDKLEVQTALQVKGAGNPGFFSDMTTVDQDYADTGGGNLVLLKDQLVTIQSALANTVVNVTLPAAILGSRTAVVIGNNTLATTFNFSCAGDDEYQEGCVVPNGGRGLTGSTPGYVSSTAGNTTMRLVINQAGVSSTALIDRNSIIYFYCVREGFWQVFVKPVSGPALTLGANQPSDTTSFIN